MSRISFNIVRFLYRVNRIDFFFFQKALFLFLISKLAVNQTDLAFMCIGFQLPNVLLQNGRIEKIRRLMNSLLTSLYGRRLRGKGPSLFFVKIQDVKDERNKVVCRGAKELSKFTPYIQ